MTFSLGLFSHQPIAAIILILFLGVGFIVTSYPIIQRLKLNKLRLIGVLLMNAVAALMIVGLAFDIQYISQKSSPVYLVTQGTTEQQIEQIDQQHQVFIMSGAITPAAPNTLLNVAAQIDDPSQILSHHFAFDNLHVLGDGLNTSQWQNLQLIMGDSFEDLLVTFSASEPRIGLIDMQWTREVSVGQYVEIEGQLQGSSTLEKNESIYQLKLLDPAGQVIQTTSVRSFERFTLNVPAKSIGQWVYQLQLIKNNDAKVLASEPIAFSVNQPSPLKILIKQSAPSFETRQLNNWAANFGSQIRIQTQISQTKHISQNINLSTAELEQVGSPFSEQSLNSFDWLLIDGRALLTLKEQQIEAIYSAVIKGLGVYIIVDNDLVNAWPVPSLNRLLNVDIQPLEVANYSSIPIWPHSRIEQTIPLVKAKITGDINTALVQNNESQILVSKSQIGMGQVAVSLINSTYGWQTAGLSEQYSHYWQSVIVALSRPKQTPYWLTTQHDSLSLVNQPAQKCLMGATDLGLTTLNQNPQPLLLTQDLVQTEKHCLTFWPTKNGWHELEWNQSTKQTNSNNPVNLGISNWFYAFSQQDWNEWRQAEKHKISRSIEQQNVTYAKKQSMQPLNKHWLWCLLVLTLSLLWLERKLF